MAQRILALAGWGQPYEALAGLLPDATHMDYAAHGNVPSALQALAEAGRDADLVVGWSLGGQLAVRAIAAGLMMPKKLVLIAAPFQFVESPGLKLGMKRDQYDKFRGNYERNPTRTLDKAWELIVKGDTCEDAVRAGLQAQSKEKALQKNWLAWLNLMDGFSCAELHLADFPPTLLVHGDSDAVVDVGQAEQFAAAIPLAKKVIFNGCGHAPHWHDTGRVQRLIREHAGV